MAASDFENLGDLPRSYGVPVLYAIARDPRTIYAYWDIDWAATFGSAPPQDRRAHLRVFDSNGVEESTMPVEPFAGNSYVAVSQGSYQLEIGYYQPSSTWNPVATSESVTMPVDGVAETTEVDLATVPFHLSFQRMIDLSRRARHDAESLTGMLARLRKRAASPDQDAALAPGEEELARAIAWSGSELEAARQPGANVTDVRLRKRLEEILGFGSSSPVTGFGGSSRRA